MKKLTRVVLFIMALLIYFPTLIFTSFGAAPNDYVKGIFGGIEQYSEDDTVLIMTFRPNGTTYACYSDGTRIVGYSNGRFWVWQITYDDEGNEVLKQEYLDDDGGNISWDERKRADPNYTYPNDYYSKGTTNAEEKDADIISWSWLGSLINVANVQLTEIGNVIAWFGNGNRSTGAYGINYVNFAKTVSYIFTAFGYAFCILFIGVNLIEKTLHYELFTLKGAVNVFGRILFAKIWIDLSVTICRQIVLIGGRIAEELIQEGNLQLPNPEILFVSENRAWWDVASALVDFFVAQFAVLPFLLFVLAVMVLTFIVTIKLIMRTFEIALMMSVAPVFFAMWVSDATRQYFKKFIMTFIGVVFELVFMAVVYAMALYWTNNAKPDTSSAIDILNWAANFGTNFIVMIAVLIMMVKPPRILRELVSA